MFENVTREYLNLAIDRLQNELEDARAMPPWDIVMLVMMACVLVACICQGILCMMLMPVAMMVRNMRLSQSSEPLVHDDADFELGSALEGVVSEPQRKTRRKKRSGGLSSSDAQIRGIAVE